MGDPGFAVAGPVYKRMWGQMVVRPEVWPIANQVATRIVDRRKERYLKVEAVTGVPWFWIAITHNRESDNDFSGVLHNGQAIIGNGQKTTWVPKGRGPFSTWEEAAVDALKLKRLDTISRWTVERCGYQWEDYNGWGYMGVINSPYVWAGSKHYVRGKYVRDGKYDPDHIDRQLGTMVLLKAMIAVDPMIQVYLDIQAADPIAPPPSPDPVPVPQPAEGLNQYHTDNLLAEVLRRAQAASEPN